MQTSTLMLAVLVSCTSLTPAIWGLGATLLHPVRIFCSHMVSASLTTMSCIRRNEIRGGHDLQQLRNCARTSSKQYTERTYSMRGSVCTWENGAGC